MVDSTILFHNENNYILIITNNPVFVNKKIILIWFPWFWFPISNTDYAQGMSEFMTKSSYKISSLFIGRQNSVRIYPPAIFDVVTTRPHILANPYYAISIFSFRQSIIWRIGHRCKNFPLL